MPDDSTTAAGSTTLAGTASLKYKTVIESYEYQRTRPGQATPTVKNQNQTFFPLPLQMPDDHYAANVKDLDMYEIGTTIDTFRDFGGSTLAEKIGAVAVTGGLALGVLSKLTGIASRATDAAGAALVAGVTAAAPFVGAYQGVARNPHTALIFDGMGLRSFNFTFRLAPRNESESIQVNNTINLFKLRMHPTYNSVVNSYALDYPFLFTVDFVGFAKNLEGIPRVGPSFLTGLSVNNASQGNAFFKNGMPAVVDVQMSFKEIDVKTREFFTGDTSRLATAGQAAALTGRSFEDRR